MSSYVAVGVLVVHMLKILPCVFADSEPASGGGEGAPEEPMEVADQTKEEQLVGKGKGGGGGGGGGGEERRGGEEGASVR